MSWESRSSPGSFWRDISGERFLGAPAMTAIPEDRRKVKMVFQETLQETNGMERDSGLAASDLAMVASVDFAAMENHLFFIGKTW